MRTFKRLPGQLVALAVKLINTAHVLQNAVQIRGRRENIVLSRVPNKQRPRRHQRANILPIKGNRSHMRKVEAELRDEWRKVRTAFQIGIAPDGCESAARNGKFNSGL